MARILIADNQRNDSFIQRLLKPTHELVVVTTMREAANALKNQEFDLIIVDLQFDESRMFDAMNLVKTVSKNADKPLICIASRLGRIHRSVVDGLDFTARALGAWMFLDVHRYNQTKDPNAELLRVIERCLVGEARKATHKARVDIQKQRGDIQRLRASLENEPWSDEADERLGALRRNLTALLLDLCDVNMENISQQEQVDESRKQHDRVAESVLEAEDKATCDERAQTREELHSAVDEFRIAEREEEAQRKRHKHAS